MPCTSTPFAASGSAMRPVPMPSSSARPPAASSASKAASAAESRQRVPLVVDVGDALAVGFRSVVHHRAIVGIPDAGRRCINDHRSARRAGRRTRRSRPPGTTASTRSKASTTRFFPLLLAAEHTERVQLTTAVVIAFARNPMTLAQHRRTTSSLASRGRFNLGLGTQIKPHIEKRFSMQWSKPAARMRELVLAIRAIWASWHEGTQLDFRGEFYTHTLMTPFFDPGPNPYGVPRIFLGGVGPRMTEVAGEVADGFMMHPFSTEKFMRETTMPALERGLATSARDRAQLEIAFPAMVIVAENDEELAARARRDAAPARVLRLDARVQGGARRPRLGRPAAGAQSLVEDRRLGDDGLR